QLHRHHGARHASGDRHRPYRPFGRLGVGLRRRGRRRADGAASHGPGAGRRRLPAAGCRDRRGAGLLGGLFRHPLLHRHAGRHAGVQGPCARGPAGTVGRTVPAQLPEIVVRLHPRTVARFRYAASDLAPDRDRAGPRHGLCQRAKPRARARARHRGRALRVLSRQERAARLRHPLLHLHGRLASRPAERARRHDRADRAVRLRDAAD
ncbi:hypothetical protein KXV85_002781, partial [Aspergillus fumigatus]